MLTISFVSGCVLCHVAEHVDDLRVQGLRVGGS